MNSPIFIVMAAGMLFGAAVAFIGIALFIKVRPSVAQDRSTFKGPFGIEISSSNQAIVIVLVGCGIFLAGLALGLALPEGGLTPGPTLSASVVSPGSTPSNPVGTRLIDRETITVDASSVLPPQGPNQYYPQYVVDGNSTTAWVEGVSGSGTGQSLVLRLGRRVRVTRMDITNGYAKSADHFLDNGRIKDVLVTTDAAQFHVILKDTRQQQTVRGPFGPTSSVTLTIESVYEGRVYEDTCLTEIRFWAAA